MKQDDDDLFVDDGEIVPFVPVSNIQIGPVCNLCGCRLGLTAFSLVFADLCPSCATAHWDELVGYPVDVSEVSDAVM